MGHKKTRSPLASPIEKLSLDTSGSTRRPIPVFAATHSYMERLLEAQGTWDSGNKQEAFVIIDTALVNLRHASSTMSPADRDGLGLEIIDLLDGIDRTGEMADRVLKRIDMDPKGLRALTDRLKLDRATPPPMGSPKPGPGIRL